MESWHDFFVAEAGAAAAFAGLLFVSLSVNQARILQYGGLPERGLQALTSLFLVFVVASFALQPGQPPARMGWEALLSALLQIFVQTRLQIHGYRTIEKAYRRSFLNLAILAQASSWLFVIGATLLIARSDFSAIYWFVPGTILAFASAGLIAWVLLIEINR